MSAIPVGRKETGMVKQERDRADSIVLKSSPEKEKKKKKKELTSQAKEDTPYGNVRPCDSLWE